MADFIRDIMHKGDHIYLRPLDSPALFGTDFEIQAVTGEGASSVCYEAIAGGMAGRLKEYNPVEAWKKLLSPVQLRRDQTTKQLTAADEGSALFSDWCMEFVRPYRLLSDVRNGAGDDSLLINPRILNNYIPVYTILEGYDKDRGARGSVYIWTPEDREGVRFDAWLNQVAEAMEEHPEEFRSRVQLVVTNLLEALISLTDCVRILHTCGILHLDLKPSNFMMACDSEGHAIAKHISVYDINSIFSFNTEMSLTYIGTEGYMAPELSYGQPEPRSDIYSIGMILYTALTLSGTLDIGYSEERASSLGSIVRDSALIRDLEIPGKAKLEDTLTLILRKCLAYDRSRRYRNCGDLKNALITAKKSVLEKKNVYGSGEAIKRNSAAALQKLLSDYPLYRHIKNEADELIIIVIGDGTWSRLFIDMSIAVAQNLRNPVKAVIYAENAENASSRYRNTRPALSEFFDIDDKYTGGLSESPYGWIQFRDMTEQKKLVREISRFKSAYIFVSRDSDIKTVKQAVELARGLKGEYTITCVYQGDGTVSREDAGCDLPSDVVMVKILEENRVRRSIEQMAFNVYLSWRGDRRESIRQERRYFREKYQYNASVANAVSIQYKLQMLQLAGLLSPGRNRLQTADHMERLLKSDDFHSVLDEMAMLEHRRWNTEKITSGWKGVSEKMPDEYYQKVAESGKVRDTLAKIHPCIAHSKNGCVLQYLDQNAWDTSGVIPAGADELDLVSLRIHRALLSREQNNGNVFASNHGLYCDYKQYDYDLIRMIPRIMKNEIAEEPEVPDYCPQPIDTAEIELPENIQDLTEKLAENIHENWAASRMKEGWHYGCRRSAVKKTTPNLVPYDMLPDEEKQFDRNSAMETLKALIKLGYQIVKE